MMYRITFHTHDTELLIGLLSAFPFEGFQEFEGRIEAYIPAEEWEQQSLSIITSVGDTGVLDGAEVLPEINWNETWEQSFQPVLIDHFCGIRASFHAPLKEVTHELIIDPKMAFGTGHHETTELMIRGMQSLDMRNKTVLDMGCGTGILAILAARSGAADVLAVDNDPEAVENARGNAVINQVQITCSLQTAPDLLPARFDLILANINRNTLISILPDLVKALRPNGYMLLSGILTGDQKDLEAAAQKESLLLQHLQAKGEWLCLGFGIAG